MTGGRKMQLLSTCLLHLCLLGLVHSQEDRCEPSFGYEKFLQVPEDTATGSVVLTLDTPGSGDEVELTLNDNNDFAFNASSQELYVKRQLDVDGDSSATTTRYTVQCREGNGQQVAISIIITVDDVNDNPPQFAQPHVYVDVGETTSVGQAFASGLRATDDDLTFMNSAIFYTIQDGPYADYFQFQDSLDTTLILQRRLDYETLRNMTITIVARNDLSAAPQLSATALLTIRVMDEDDLNPVFTSPMYEGVIMETAALNSIVNVTPPIQATDADVTLDMPVVYSFHDQFFPFDRDAQGAQTLFAIDNETAEVRLVGSSHPTKVSMVVQAAQQDNPSRYGVAMLVVTIRGVSSNAPRFQQDVYTQQVSEVVPPTTTVLFVSATDLDFGAVIQYTIVGGSSLFAVARNSGAVTLEGRLDYETARSHNITVLASDGTMNSTATVVVNVLDANDNNPIIANRQVTVDAQRNTGDVLTTVQAQDADAGTTLTYRLDSYNSLFAIDQSGTVRITADPADLTDNHYVLVVVVSDSGDPPREKTVLVTVTFPPLGVTSTPATVMAGPGDDIAAIALGAVAAVLLVVVIILVVYICRRRNKNSEQLDKARLNRSPDPRGLKFQNAQRAAHHIHFQGDDVSDGATTVQENPLKEAGAFNYGFVHPEDAENNRHMDEIHIETAVIPYGTSNPYSNITTTNNNDGGAGAEMYQHDDSSEYAESLPRGQQGLMKGLYPDTSSESLNTSHTNSSGEGAKQLLMGNGVTSFGTTSFGVNQTAGGAGGGRMAEGSTDISMEGLDPDCSLAPPERKSELTVYF